MPESPLAERTNDESQLRTNDESQLEHVLMNDGMDIGDAIRMLRGAGKRVARQGWNGKNMYLAYQPGYPDGVAINANTARATGLPEGTVCKFLPYIMMRTADGSFVPWLCSQTDLLATDWVVVE